jgi:hypothetical protein
MNSLDSCCLLLKAYPLHRPQYVLKHQLHTSWMLFTRYDTFLARYDTLFVRYDTLLARYDTLLACYDTRLARYDTPLALCDTL